MEIKIEESKYILCLFKINWHKSGTFLGLLKRQISVIHWYQWRTSRDSNPEPTDQKSYVPENSRQLRIRQVNNISKLNKSYIPPLSLFFLLFCKLVSQECHRKIFKRSYISCCINLWLIIFFWQKPPFGALLQFLIHFCIKTCQSV